MQGKKEMTTDNKKTFYYIAMKRTTDNNGFGYQTNEQPRRLWDGKEWTTDKAKAITCDNNPRMRMIAARLLDAEVVTM